MPGEIVASSMVAATIEKTTEAAIAAKTVEGAATASLASKVGAVAEKAVKELPKAIGKTVAVDVVNRVADEIDPSVGDVTKMAEKIYGVANASSVVAGAEKLMSDGIHEVAKENPDLGAMVKVVDYAKSTISYLNVKFNEVIDEAKEEKNEKNKEKKIKESDDSNDGLKPNSTIEIGGRVYDTDDKGNIFKVDGYELLPNKEYIIDGVNYTTDDKARITSCEGMAKKMPEGERDNIAQVLAGGEDRKPGDQGGHILARILGGAKGIENMLAMRGTAINQSVYKRMENEIGRALDDGKKVGIKAKIEYKDDSQRPSKITISYSIDGKERVVQFDNDEGSTELLSGLENKLEELDYNDLCQEIVDAKEDGTTISIVSVKSIYDKNGKAEKIIVTMRDETSDHPVNEDRVLTPKEEA